VIRAKVEVAALPSTITMLFGTSVVCAWDHPGIPKKRTGSIIVITSNLLSLFIFFDLLEMTLLSGSF
jgi:hypothetical protein